MTRLVYRDFDEFADALVGVCGRFIPTAREMSEWWREGICPGTISLRQMQIGSPATFAGDGQPGSFTLGLPLTDARQIRIDGHFLEPDAFIVLHEDQPFTFAASDVVRWAGINVPLESSLIAPELLALARSGSGLRTRASLPYLDRLRDITERAISSQADFSDQAAAIAIDEEVALCVTHVLERSMKVRDRHLGRPQFARDRIIARALALIEAREGHPLFIDDLCRATQVSERTLRNIFHEFFGVGPMRLIKLRQLREIHAALLRADPQRDTVTRIAARFGIWDFNLFARNYKALFGESPSQTMRMFPNETQSRSPLSWLQYASKLFTDDTPRLREPGAQREESAPLVIAPSGRVPAPPEGKSAGRRDEK